MASCKGCCGKPGPRVGAAPKPQHEEREREPVAFLPGTSHPAAPSGPVVVPAGKRSWEPVDTSALKGTAWEPKRTDGLCVDGSRGHHSASGELAIATRRPGLLERLPPPPSGWQYEVCLRCGFVKQVFLHPELLKDGKGITLHSEGIVQ